VKIKRHGVADLRVPHCGHAMILLQARPSARRRRKVTRNEPKSCANARPACRHFISTRRQTTLRLALCAPLSRPLTSRLLCSSRHVCALGAGIADDSFEPMPDGYCFNGRPSRLPQVSRPF
jgi:hypothetical protein